MKRLPEFRSVDEQFPWVRFESDGTCCHDLVKARFSVLGPESTFGYWSVPGGTSPHDDSKYSRPASKNDSPFKSIHSRTKGYTHGEMLLNKEWPTDIQSWSLKDEELIPRLFFDEDHPPPEKPKAEQVKDWAINILRVADTAATVTSRKSLNVHLLGVEIELNYLPLFSELAFLLPNTDTTLTLFGQPVYDLVHEARKHFPGSLATQSTVWSYTAPKQTGRGSISIKLYAEAETWTKQVLLNARGNDSPHAMIGLNAGLLSYTAWGDPIMFNVLGRVPFAITEYAEQSLEHLARELLKMWEQKTTTSHCPNPFHRPGQRPLPVIRMPNFYNGFTMPVVLPEGVESSKCP
ncbi:hypothetical protein K439DRAFT_1648355 [Ramaria rubella]|nr:hypothetical protein K439DRAFT_1648355 [Ramaria rubella]